MKPVQRLMLLTAALLGVAALGAFAYLQLKPKPVAALGGSVLDSGYDGQPTLGAADAPVKLILFENFLCEHCKAFETSVFGQLKRDYLDSGQVEAYYVNLAWGEADAVRAGRAGECAFAQNLDAFWDYKTALFAAQGAAGWATLGRVVQVAATIPGLDAQALRTCVQDGSTQHEVTRDLELADFVGVTGTPSVVVEAQGLEAQGFEAPSYAVLKAEIDRQLAQLE